MKEKKGFYQNNKWYICFVLVGCVLAVLTAIISPQFVDKDKDMANEEQVYWDKCVEENTSLSYSKYIIHYPDGKHSTEAKKMLNQLKETEQATE